MPSQRRMQVQDVVISLAVLVCVSACTGASRDSAGGSSKRQPSLRCDAESLSIDLHAVLEAMLLRNPVPGISAAVQIPSLMDAPVTSTVGVSSLSGGHALSPADRFLAGSVGKTFFAAAALRRVGAGGLQLDQPVSRYLSGTGVAAFDWITPRMLLTHTSGIGEYDGPFMESLIREPMRERTAADWLGVINRNPPQRKDAGVFRYSDLNYVVLAMVLDGGTPGGAYHSIQRDLLSPLGLHETAPSVDPKVERLVDGYDGKGSMFGSDAMQRDGRLIYNPQFEWGGGGFASTPRDLARWMAAFRRGEAFPDSLWPMAVARPPGTPDTASKWRGMGIHVDSGALGKTFGHSGYMPGYVSWIRWYEKPGVSVAIQTNASDRDRLHDDGFDWADSLASHASTRCRIQ